MDSTLKQKAKKATLYSILTILIVIVLDQWLKFHIKTTFHFRETVDVYGTWFKLYFTENPGMAFGLTFGGKWGKIILTVFRIIASVFIFYYIRTLIKSKAHTGLVILVSLIFAGALGNIIDSVFYGVIFNESTYHQVASFMPPDGGYGNLMMGKVVDMFYFPLIDTILPEWIPYFGGERFQFFRPVFNLADAAISVGVITILVFRKRLFQS